MKASQAAAATATVIFIWLLYRNRKKRKHRTGKDNETTRTPSSRLLQLPKGTVICTAVTAAECDQYLAPLVSYASAMVKSRASETNALAIGFDAEFRQDKSSRRGPKKSKVESAETGGVFRREDTVALVQIAFPRDPTHGLNGDVVVLIRLSSIGKVLPKSLETILSCRFLVPVGVGIAQDLRLLEKQFTRQGSSNRGWSDRFLELAVVAAVLCREERGIGLRRLVERFCSPGATCEPMSPNKGGNVTPRSEGTEQHLSAPVKITLSKDPKIRCSKWETSKDLSPEQITYAAVDAYAGLAVLRGARCCARRRNPDSTTAVNRKSDSNDYDDSVAWCAELVGVCGKRTSRDSSDKPLNRNSASSSQILSTSKPYAFVAKTKNMYNGCKMFDPHGTHLCNIQQKRADWYIRSGLATLICKPPHEAHPCQIRLNFEPRINRPRREREEKEKRGEGVASEHRNKSVESDDKHWTAPEIDEFQRATRENICVGCGGGTLREKNQSGTPVECGGGASDETDLGDRTACPGESNHRGKTTYDADEWAGLNRFNIVPQSFRRLLPRDVKGRSSHDIVLLCRECAARADFAARERRAKLLAEAGLETHHVVRPTNLRRRAAKGAAKALLANERSLEKQESEYLRGLPQSEHLPEPPSESRPTEKRLVSLPVYGVTGRRKHKGGGTIPEARLIELRNTVQIFLERKSWDEVTAAELQECAMMSIALEAAIGSGKNTPEYVLMSRLGLLAECFDAEGKLCDHSRRDNSTHEKSLFERERRVQRFVEDWRKVFVSAVEPKYLPRGWNIERPVWSNKI